MSGSDLEIYIVGGAGLFFLASGCLKLIVVRILLESLFSVNDGRVVPA
jgi:hypothetical protein|eukprot:COSAG02_NODE_3326_length_6935_cov_9.834552_2_plen_48_part_00